MEFKLGDTVWFARSVNKIAKGELIEIRQTRVYETGGYTYIKKSKDQTVYSIKDKSGVVEMTYRRKVIGYSKEELMDSLNNMDELPYFEEEPKEFTPEELTQYGKDFAAREYSKPFEVKNRPCAEEAPRPNPTCKDLGCLPTAYD